MNTKSFKEAGASSPFTDWMKNSTDLWGQISQKGFGSFESMMEADNKKNSQGKEWWDSAFKTWEKATPDFVNTDKQVNEFSNVIQKGWKSFLDIQQKMFENISDDNGKKQENKSKIDEKMFNVWGSLYNNEISKIFSVPQLGLNREYQEKIANLCDKLNRFQIKNSEFMNLLFIPVKNAARDMQKEFMELAKKGELPKNNEEFYKEWIKKLEKSYNEIYQSSEYSRVMGGTLFAMSEFVSVRDDLLQNMMKTLPIPSQTDMDDLYKDIYKLKKRIQTLEKEARAKK